MSFHSHVSPPTQKAMVFVDGSNLLIAMGDVLGTTLRAEDPAVDHLSLATQTVAKSLAGSAFAGHIGPHRVVRSYWFGSVQGSDEKRTELEASLRDFCFEGQLFRKVKGKQEKGVDLAVAREMLMHGFHRNYDTAVLVAGDEDYVGLVQDLKRLGLLVVCAFYECSALSPRLRVACDRFAPLPTPDQVNVMLAATIRGGPGAA